ncbi:hypothetical protein RB213_012391 [Colletotrichum asianum]
MVDRHDVSTLGTALQRPSRGGGGDRLMPGHDGVSLASFVLWGRLPSTGGICGDRCVRARRVALQRRNAGRSKASWKDRRRIPAGSL